MAAEVVHGCESHFRQPLKTKGFFAEVDFAEVPYSFTVFLPFRRVRGGRMWWAPWHALTEVEVAPAGALFHPLRFPLGVAFRVCGVVRRALCVVALGVGVGVAGSGGLGGSGGKRVGASAGVAAVAGSHGRSRARPKSALTRKVGGRLYTRHPGEEVAGRWGRWILVHVPSWSRGGYQSYKLFLDKKSERRRLWHVSVKNGLPYGGVFIAHLAANHPDALEWAVNQMEVHERELQSEAEG